jgi:hypothetical protein
MVVRLRGLRGVQKRRGGLQVRGGARGLVVPWVVSQKGRGRAARAGAGAARATASAARASAAPHPLRRAEVPGGRRRDGRGGTRWRSAGPRVLLRGDFTAFPHLLELRSAVLEPDFDLCGKRTWALVEEPGSLAARGGNRERPPAPGGLLAPLEVISKSWCLCVL